MPPELEPLTSEMAGSRLAAFFDPSLDFLWSASFLIRVGMGASFEHLTFGPCGLNLVLSAVKSDSEAERSSGADAEGGASTPGVNVKIFFSRKL